MPPILEQASCAYHLSSYPRSRAVIEKMHGKNIGAVQHGTRTQLKIVATRGSAPGLQAFRALGHSVVVAALCSLPRVSAPFRSATEDKTPQGKRVKVHRVTALPSGGGSRGRRRGRRA